MFFFIDIQLTHELWNHLDACAVGKGLGVGGRERDFRMFGEARGDFHLREILQGDFHIVALQSAIDHFVNIRFRIVIVYGFTKKGKRVFVLGSNNGYADIDVGKQVLIVIIHGTGDLANIA